MEFLITTILYYILITVSLFGAYAVYKLSPLNKTTKMFIGVCIMFSISMLLCLIELMNRPTELIEYSSPLNYAIILIANATELFMLFFFYNQIFSTKASIKIIGIHMIPFGLIYMVIFLLGVFADAPQFVTFTSMDEVMLNIDSPIVILRFSLILLQLLFVFCLVYIYRKLIPIYQTYIESNISKAESNMFWIKEIGNIYLIVILVSIIDEVFQNYTSNIIYSSVMLVVIIRLIVGFLRYRPIEESEDLYEELKIKWSLSRMWYVEDEEVNPGLSVKPNELQELFNEVDTWIISEKAYLNTNLTFKTINNKFPDIDYKLFNVILSEIGVSSFQTYIRNCRINEAKIMINANPSILIKELAYQVGFENADAFSRAFRETTGKTATQWKKAAKMRDE